MGAPLYFGNEETLVQLSMCELVYFLSENKISLLSARRSVDTDICLLLILVEKVKQMHRCWRKFRVFVVLLEYHSILKLSSNLNLGTDVWKLVRCLQI